MPTLKCWAVEVLLLSEAADEHRADPWFWGTYLYRLSFYATCKAEESQRALKHPRETIAVEGPDRIAAIIIEPVVGASGVLVPPPGYLAGVRELRNEFGIVMIADEVMCGFGRCGECFAVDHWNVVPDLITFAKGVNSGYAPLGGVVISEESAEIFAERPFLGPGLHRLEEQHPSAGGGAGPRRFLGDRAHP